MIVPTFAERQELARYIDEINRLKGNRPAAAAFIDLPSADASTHHLSVNSLEVESIDQIAAYHRWRTQPADGKAALCVHKVHVYSEAARKAGVQLNYNKSLSRWEFLGRSKTAEEAYKHRPVAIKDNPFGSPSHCGVEFARVMDANAAAKFARRLVKGKFHVVSARKK